jgi:hypothetical protein
MAAERQEERSDEKQAGLGVEKAVQLASAAGQADPPKVPTVSMIFSTHASV